jgi:hypothetical protein
MIGELQGFFGKSVYRRFSVEALEVPIIGQLRFCQLKCILSCCHMDPKLHLSGITGPNYAYNRNLNSMEQLKDDVLHSVKN